jgi:hypothetical protein
MGMTISAGSDVGKPILDGGDNPLNLLEENAPSRKVGFPTSHPAPDPRLPQPRLGKPCHENAMPLNRFTLELK